MPPPDSARRKSYGATIVSASPPVSRDSFTAGSCSPHLYSTPSSTTSRINGLSSSYFPIVQSDLRGRILGAAVAVAALFAVAGTCAAVLVRTSFPASAYSSSSSSSGPSTKLSSVRGGAGDDGPMRRASGVQPSSAGLAEDRPDYSSAAKLKVVATNEYGEYDPASLEAYGLAMVIEPFRVTTVTVEGMEDSPRHSNRFIWRLQHASHEGVPNEDVDDAWAYDGGHQATLRVDKPGTVYILSVKQFDAADVVVAEGTMTVSCKYVRREIRELTDEDREAFFEAMEIWYTLPRDVGRMKYGPEFDGYQRIVGIHNAEVDQYCYHIGNQFLTSHVAFDLMVERQLQLINPKISLPMWDYMIDSATLGDKWYNSILFDPQWFGSAISTPENDYMLADSRFNNISTIFDPDNSLVGSEIESYHNAYGLVNAPNNYQDSPRLTRTSTFCGLPAEATFATAEVFISCFEESTTLVEWEYCMETMVHGDIHGYMGGAFSCNADMAAFSRDHPEYSPRLLSFVLEYITFAFWPINTFIPSANTCDTECTRGQTEPCGCTCSIDAFAISDQEVYTYMQDFMVSASAKFQGNEFVTYDGDAQYPYGFMQDQERLSDEDNLLLMRYLVKIGCEPGATGYMTTLASPLDPLFHVLHSMFEKALHIVWLSPKYSRQIKFEWVTGLCPGSGFTDELPFTEAMLGLGSGTTFMTNERILELTHPKNPAMTYIYEGFAKWGTSDSDSWDPFSDNPHLA